MAIHAMKMRPKYAHLLLNTSEVTKMTKKIISKGKVVTDEEIEAPAAEAEEVNTIFRCELSSDGQQCGRQQRH